MGLSTSRDVCTDTECSALALLKIAPSPSAQVSLDECSFPNVRQSLGLHDAKEPRRVNDDWSERGCAGPRNVHVDEGWHIGMLTCQHIVRGEAPICIGDCPNAGPRLDGSLFLAWKSVRLGWLFQNLQVDHVHLHRHPRNAASTSRTSDAPHRTWEGNPGRKAFVCSAAACVMRRVSRRGGRPWPVLSRFLAFSFLLARFPIRLLKRIAVPMHPAGALPLVSSFHSGP